MPRQIGGKKALQSKKEESPSAPVVNKPDGLKRVAKRKRRVQAMVIMQSQDDGGDEVVWKVSPTAARLQAAAASGELQPSPDGQERSVLLPCRNLGDEMGGVCKILSKVSPNGVSNPKKKKSPGMAGKLEQWLTGSLKVPPGKSKVPQQQGENRSATEDKENTPNGMAPQKANPKEGVTPGQLKKSANTSQRPPTSSRRRSLKTVTNQSQKSATKQPERRKALLELLDQVDNVIHKKEPTPRHDLKEGKEKSPKNKGSSPDAAITVNRQFSITRYLSPQSECDKLKPVSCLQDVSGISGQLRPDVDTDLNICEKAVLRKVRKLDIVNDKDDDLSRTCKDGSALMGGNTSVLGSSDAGCQVLQQHACAHAGSDQLGCEPNIHFLVLEVADGEYDVDSKVSYPQKNLRLLDEQSGAERFVHLRDSWCHSDVETGDTVNVIGDFDSDGKCVIDREHNLLVINPDILISGSKVGGSVVCPRRAVLDERIKQNEVSYPALMGTMLHQLFQVSLRSERPSPDILKSEAKLIIQRHFDGLYATGVPEQEALVKLVEAIPTILSWRQQYVGPTAEAPQIEFDSKEGRQSASVCEILDIEEMIWSPKHGLKGRIDVSVRMKLENLSLGNEERVMPLELKTGKATSGQAGVEHRAQVILYSLLLSDRYMQTVGAGLLYYLHTNQTQGVRFQHSELVGLVMRRNEHAGNLLRAAVNQTLPPMLQNYNMCNGCRQLDTCTVYHKAQDGGTAESSGLGDLFDKSTNHLTTTHLHFLKKWDRLIDLEAQDLILSHSEIWRMPSGKREELGRCISSVVLDMSTEKDVQENTAGTYLYTFRRTSLHPDLSSRGNATPTMVSLHDRPFTIGDYVFLSTESGHTAVAGGFVVTICDNSISIRLAHKLHLPKRPQSLKGSNFSQEIWRIDKDDSASSLAIMRLNLLQLFVNRNGDQQRRRLIVDLEAPKFESGTVDDTDPAARYVRSALDLNDDQKHAVNRIITAKDYALVLGMPGTGKTSTIVHAVIALLARKASVLLTSYTNSAVDNILLKLKKMGVDFIRVGRTEAVHPDLRDKVLGGGISVASVEDFQSVVEKVQVVGVTCLGITHALFAKRKFDVCIVDEAGQITLPICLGPLQYARTFVLVGDHYQLPPLVRTPEAKEQGMAVSLFRRLSEAHPQSISALQSQYRMCADIMALSNCLIYGDRLRCGSPHVANGVLNIPKPPKDLPPWLLQVVQPTRRVLFLDTDGLDAEESRVQRNKVYNSTEASLLMKIVEVLVKGGVGCEKIGVISPYNAQVEYIVRLASSAGYSNLEVHTVDKYQGRDKDCILMSFVRSNSQKRMSASLLSDWHRINVAITRAKTKLLMIGSRKTLSSAPILKLLIQKVDEGGGIIELPRGDTSTGGF